MKPRTLFGILFTLALVVSCVVGKHTAVAQFNGQFPPVVQYPFSINSVANTPWFNVPPGEQSCTISVQTAASAVGGIVQGSSDNTNTVVTLNQFGTISTPAAGTQISGPVIGTGSNGSALTQIRISVTSITGSFGGVITCSPSQFPTVALSGAITAQVSGVIPVTLPTACGGGTAGNMPCPAITSSPGGVVLTNDVQPNASPWPTSAAGQRTETVCDKTTGTQCVAVSSGGFLTVAEAALTGNGGTRLAAASITSNAVVTISSSAATLYALSLTWSAPTTLTNCYLTIYNATAPTVGTAFTEIYTINTSVPGTFSAPIPPTIGEAYGTAITAAVATTTNGSTACNSAANSMYLQAVFK